MGCASCKLPGHPTPPATNTAVEEDQVCQGVLIPHCPSITTIPEPQQPSDIDISCARKLSSKAADYAMKFIAGQVGEEEALSEICRGSVIQITGYNALAYLPFFKDDISKINQNHGYYIEFVPEGDMDMYGRVTYFLVRLGPDKLLVYIPGTPMFRSGVCKNSPLEVYAKGCQQNGPVLGLSCARWLAEMCCKLGQGYEKYCTEKHCSSTKRNPDCILKAFEKILPEYCLSDANEHGRLIEMMSAFTKLVETMPEQSVGKIRSYCLLKDLAEKDGTHSVTELDAYRLTFRPVLTHEYESLMQTRQSSMVYPKFEEVFAGATSPEQLIRTLAEGFMEKKLFVVKDESGKTVDSQAQESNNAGVKQLCDQLIATIRTVSANPSRRTIWKRLTKQQRNQDVYERYMKENQLVQAYAEQLKRLLQGAFTVAGFMPTGMVEPNQCRRKDVVSTSLKELAKALPSTIGTLLHRAGSAVESWNEAKFLEQLSRIYALVSDQREMAAQELTVRLTLARRGLLARIKKDDLQDLIARPGSNLKELYESIASKVGLMSPPPEVWLAFVDYTMVEACMICIPDQQVADFKRIPDVNKRCMDVVEFIVTSFTKEQKVSTIAAAPEHDEVIVPYQKPSEALDDSLFDHPDYKHVLPRMWIKTDQETLEEWKDKMVTYLRSVDKGTFSEVMKIADPLSPRRRILAELVDKAAMIDQQERPWQLPFCGNYFS